METFDSKNVLVKTQHGETIAIIFSGFAIDRIPFVIVGIPVVTVYRDGEFFHIISIVETKPEIIVGHGAAVQVIIGVLEAGKEHMFAPPTLNNIAIDHFQVMLVTVSIQPILLRAGQSQRRVRTTALVIDVYVAVGVLE
jgi:hypothetical protein